MSKVFKEKRATNKNYKFKDALVDAKKMYRKTTTAVDSMGPGLMKKAAKSLKKAMKKTRKHRRHRGGVGEEGEEGEEGDIANQLQKTVASSFSDVFKSNEKASEGEKASEPNEKASEPNEKASEHVEPPLPVSGGKQKKQQKQKKGGKTKKQQKRKQ